MIFIIWLLKGILGIILGRGIKVWGGYVVKGFRISRRGIEEFCSLTPEGSVFAKFFYTPTGDTGLSSIDAKSL